MAGAGFERERKRANQFLPNPLDQWLRHCGEFVRPTTHARRAPVDTSLGVLQFAAAKSRKLRAAGKQWAERAAKERGRQHLPATCCPRSE